MNSTRTCVPSDPISLPIHSKYVALSTYLGNTTTGSSAAKDFDNTRELHGLLGGGILQSPDSAHELIKRDGGDAPFLIVVTASDKNSNHVLFA